MLRSIKNIPYSIWVITCAHAVTDLAPGALFVALPFFKAKFDLSYAELTAIILIQNLTSSVSQPIFGYFSDKKSRPWWMPVGCFVTGIVMLASLLVPTYPLVLLCTAISGFGSAIFHPEGAKMVNWLSGKAKGKGASLFSVGGNAGFAIGSAFLGTLLLGDSVTLYLFALPYLAISMMFLFVMKQLSRLPQNRGNFSAEAKLSVNVNLPLIALLGMVLIRATVNSGISTFVPLYCVAFLHDSSAYAASLLTVYLAAGAVGTLLGGTMSDRYGSRQVMFYSILPVAVLVFLFQISSGILGFILLALVSILLAATFTSSLVLAQKMMPRNIGMASGLTLGFSMGLGAMGVLGLGWMADVSGLPWVFNLLAFLPVVGFVFTLFVQEPAEGSETLDT
ncbi:FSR family fosmidomycin resistance protein-like MFS transporter [Sporomusaceae bacterium BoRhaA]|uniref:MFS transporter n=1 Tax=Pelorhabdus rhamnosifermentans TaxID=2772457 RepID=UPI001C0606ED|nr:MFS transporter [Pelorhabdus rhamnosifermentans]MBU2700734.1 FSR family fosmidomycin resistance protein-like MFS transporter [Pelorhabdus rhamnosifermentans]